MSRICTSVEGCAWNHQSVRLQGEIQEGKQTFAERTWTAVFGSLPTWHLKLYMRTHTHTHVHMSAYVCSWHVCTPHTGEHEIKRDLVDQDAVCNTDISMRKIKMKSWSRLGSLQGSLWTTQTYLPKCAWKDSIWAPGCRKDGGAVSTARDLVPPGAWPSLGVPSPPAPMKGGGRWQRAAHSRVSP